MAGDLLTGVLLRSDFVACDLLMGDLLAGDLLRDDLLAGDLLRSDLMRRSIRSQKSSSSIGHRLSIIYIDRLSLTAKLSEQKADDKLD